MMETLKRHWLKLLVAALLLAGGAGFWVYTTMFHVDPDFTAEQERLEQDKEAFDEALGIEDEGGFDDLEADLESE
ncbi:MAG: hypothetical protein ACQEXJ_23180 [Myxococcota bacterium]